MTIATAEVHEHDRDMDRSKFEEALQDALSQLDETKRTTFELRFVHELSNPEIAETMGCSEGTVKSRIFYTLKELNGILQEYKELLISFLFIILKS
jgi:RNA polymerase sigma-70 factor (ECF subfamily)